MATGVSQLSRARSQNLVGNENYDQFKLVQLKSGLIQSLHSTVEIPAYILADNAGALIDLANSGVRADLVYMDPPYNTGLDFETLTSSHAYSDKYDTRGYLEMMRRRFELVWEVMSDSSSLYVQIGPEMFAHLKVMLDEIFGANNFRNMLVRRKCSSKNYTTKRFPNLNDYILFYTKGPNYIWNQPTQKPSEDWIRKEYSKIDEQGRRYKLVPIHAPGRRNGDTGKEWRGLLPPEGKHWQYKPSKLDELADQGLIYWSKNGNPRRIVYLSKDKKLPLTDYLHDYRDAYHQSTKVTGYPTEKNLELIKMLVGASSNHDSIVLDPFVGSGTTIEAAYALGRKPIGIDASLESFKTVIERFSVGKRSLADVRKKTKFALPSMFEKIPVNFYADVKALENDEQLYKKVRQLSLAI